MDSHDARNVANFFLDMADQLSMPLSNISVQKILYFAQGWHYAYFDKPLIKNKFEAWQYGPVIRIVYENFKGFKNQPIYNFRAQKHDVIKNQKIVCNYNFCDRQKDFLKGILLEYGPIRAHNLVEMSHVPGSPWHQIWERPKDEDAVGLIIPEHLIKEYFKCAFREKSIVN